MTTNVPKGAGRAAHAAKTRKHAQRTPLPEKGATSGVSKKVSADAIKESVEESRTTKGRSRARKAAPSTAPAAKEAPAPSKRPAAKRTGAASPLAGKGTAAERGAVSKALKKAGAAKKAAPVASKAKKEAPAQETARAKKEARSGQPSAAPVAGSKAQALAEWARSVGWSAEHEEHGTNETVICEREPERVTVHFADNKLDLAMMPTHEYGARVVKLRNVSAAKKVMETSPEEAAKAQPESGPRRERTARGRLETAEGEEGAAVLRKRLPWPDGDAPEDAELLSLVVGRRIVWKNNIGGTYEEAHVLPTPVDKQRHLRIVLAPNGKRTLNFASVEGGFRSVYVENIWQVR